jgi:large subunit ribosomal protein L37Ae
MEKKKFGSVRRFGTRYGRRIKEKLAKIEMEQKAKHTCPYCHYPKVRRVAVGIWACTKCKAKFSGKAYSVSRKIVTKDIEETEQKEAK